MVTQFNMQQSNLSLGMRKLVPDISRRTPDKIKRRGFKSNKTKNFILHQK